MSNQDLNKEIVSFMQEMRTNFSEVKAELGEIKTDVSGLKTDVAGLKTDVAGLKNDVTVLKADVAELKNDIAVLKVDVSELKEDVAELKGKVDKLEADVAGNKKDIASLYVLNEKLSVKPQAELPMYHTSHIRLMKKYQYLPMKSSRTSTDTYFKILFTNRLCALLPEAVLLSLHLFTNICRYVKIYMI